MRESQIVLAVWLSATSLVWTITGLYLVIVLGLPPALDPLGLARTVLLAPGYAAYLLSAAVAQTGPSANPWLGAVAVAGLLALLSSVIGARFVARS